jgi:hypothetical protein
MLAMQGASLARDALRAPDSLFEFPEPGHPNFLMFLSVPPLYTLLVVHKQNDLPHRTRGRQNFPERKSK